MIKWVKKLFKRKSTELVYDTKPEPTAEPKRKNIYQKLLAKLTAGDPQEIKPYQPPPGVIPKGEEKAAMAMDTTPYDYVNQAYINTQFVGYQFLATLSQLPEYRKFVTVPASDMTRTWITLSSKGDGDKTDTIQKINDALEKFNVRELFQQAAENDLLFGRCQLYIDLEAPNGGKVSDDPAELAAPLIIDKAKIKKGSLKGFVLVEPVWTYPGIYNSTDPLASDFYKPRSWYVMGKTVHADRLLMFLSNPVPDLLKPSYNFGGMSLTQMAQPYVNNWTRTRDSVSDLVHSFSVSGIKTNMDGILSGTDDAEFFARVELFNKLRDTRSAMLLDMETEEFFQFNTPLSTLDELQAQSQEHMASVASIPLVKFLGITPSGLNASAEGEIEMYYDRIGGDRTRLFKDNLIKVIDIIQLSELGAIDPDITFEFDTLYGQDAVEASTVRKTNADTDAVLIQSGVISQQESRDRIANDPESGYNSLRKSIDDDDDIDETGTELETGDDD